jgi:DnaJ-class molecular chaperone
VSDQTPSEPVPCSPCRGTGKVTSKLGGEAHEVPCPWCEGTGTFIPEHDAQAARRADAGVNPDTGG